MKQLQNVYIKILSPFEIISNKHNQSTRHFIILVCFAILFTDILIGYTDETKVDITIPLNKIIMNIFSIGDFGRTLVGIFVLLIIIIMSVEKGLRIIEWNWMTVSVWMLSSILIIIPGVFHNIGSGLLISQVAIMLLLPCLYFVWQNRGDIEKLFDLMAQSFTAILLIYSIKCMADIPCRYNDVTGLRYFATTHNPNLLAFFALMGCIASLYLIMRNKKITVVINMIALGFSLGLLVMTISRGSMLAFLMVLILWILMYFKLGKPLKKILVTAVIVLISFNVLYFSICGGTDIQNIYSFATNNTVVYAADETTQTSGSSVSSRVDDFKSINQFSSGRIGIWQIYLKELNASGNDVTYALPIRIVKYDGSGIYYYRYAHNNAIEIAFRAGIPAGIVYILMELIILAYALIHLFKKRKDFHEYDVFTIMMIFAFIIVSSVESIEYIFLREITLAFYFSLIPLFLNNSNVKKVSKDDAQ